MKKILIVSLLIVLGIHYSNAQFGIKKGTKSAPDRPNNGISGPVHQKYMNKIVFAKTEKAIEFKAEIESEFITEATLGDIIYTRAYLDNSLVNYLKGQVLPENYGDFLIKFHLDGEELYKSPINTLSSGDKIEFTTFRGALKTNNKSFLATGEGPFKAFILEHEAKFTPGKHVLKVEYLPYYKNRSGEEYTGPVVASGEITLDVKGSVVDPNDPTTCIPIAKKTDKNLEADIAKAYKEKGYTAEPKEIRILSPDWKIVRHQTTGIAMYRMIEAVVATSENGKCFYQYFSFNQDFDGATYQKNVYLYSTGSQHSISCGCIKSK